MKKNRQQLFNIPNSLCFFRILLIPLFLLVYFNADSKEGYLIAAGILVVSGLSDFLDGFIARKFNQVTDFGKFIDPVADKLTQFTVVITLLFNYPMMIVLLAIIILKDLMLLIVGMYLYNYGLKITGASWWGKVATAYFYVIVIFLTGVYIPKTTISMTLILIGSALMLLSFVLYARELYYMVKEKDKLIDEQTRN